MSSNSDQGTLQTSTGRFVIYSVRDTVRREKIFETKRTKEHCVKEFKMSARLRAKIRAGLGDPAAQPARQWNSCVDASGVLFPPKHKIRRRVLSEFENPNKNYDFRAPKLPPKQPHHFERPSALKFSALQTLAPEKQKEIVNTERVPKPKVLPPETRQWNNRTKADFDADKLREEQTRKAIAHSRKFNGGLSKYMTLRQRYKRSTAAARAAAERQAGAE